MFDWGTGSNLGLLTLLGYLAFAVGLVSLWRCRHDVAAWIETESYLFRRRFSRYVVVGPFYGPRTESRIWLVPGGLIHSVTRLSQRRFTWAAILLCIGLTLFVLDFFV
jgi:hypothetical protein